MNFTHLHVHSNYSPFDGLARVMDIVDKCIASGMNAVALTDHGNMNGIKELLNYCKFINEERSLSGIKPFIPIVGVEAYCARRGRHSMSDMTDRGGWHVVLLAKNMTGYQNLCRLVSASNQEDAFFVVPRIDHELLEQYHEGLICCSACIGGELPQKVLAGLQTGDMSEARKTVEWFKNLFGDDYYIELQRHETRRRGANRQTYQLQSAVNPVLIDLAHEYGVKLICSNDAHFVNKDDADEQDLIMCFNSNRERDDKNRIRFSKQEWIKSPEEMAEIFRDLPETLANTQEIVDKVELYDIDHAPILPKFDLAITKDDAFFHSVMQSFDVKQNNECKINFVYMMQSVLQGAVERYGETILDSRDFKHRLKLEWDVLYSSLDSATYLLIVADLVKAARKMGIVVGPGRGSVAGSLVAYCLRITDIDPLKYGLLFERFYTATSILPDIDLDVEDCERDKLIDYLVQKYGEAHVAHIIMYPRHGLIRRPYVHACGVALCGEELRNILPLSSVQDKRTNKRIVVTGYNGLIVESVGAIKLDILGLLPLTAIKKCLRRIKRVHGIDLDINSIPTDDELTLQLFREGRTSDICQFQSEDMQQYLRELFPTSFEELIALNAMCRPGPMENIPHYIARKHGKEPIQYDIPVMETYLKETYGIIVYQEQLMLLCQKIANFTPRESDMLRKAFSGRKESVIETELRNKFMAGGLKNGYTEDELTKVWTHLTTQPWYLFVKAHAACYTWLAYQMAYLKAHYPNEFACIEVM